MTPWLSARAALTPSLPALRVAGRELDFATLARRAADTARRLRGIGLREGDLLAVLLGSGLAWVELAHAAPLCGATLLPLNTRLTARELAFQLADARPRLLVHGPDALADAARRAAAALPGLARVGIAPGDAPRLHELPADPGALRDELVLEETAAVLYTSGTSGAPKGAELSYANLLWSAVASAVHLGTVPGDRWLACLPLFHVGGLSILFRSVLTGAAVTLHERFEPEAVSRALDADDITLVSLVAATLQRLLDARDGRQAPPGLRAVLLGGGPLPAALLERARALGFPVLPSYGLTETASQVATLPLHEAPRADSVGRPLFGSRIRIVGDDGVERPTGEPGEIEVRGPSVMKGYLGRPAETAAALRDGWLRTGDIGLLLADGSLRVLDRRSDLVVSAGENVYPAEVEAALLEHPAVAEAGVAGEPDAAFGRRVAAWIVLRPGLRAEAEEIRAFCRARLAGYKVPRAIRFVSALPRNAAGKLLRRALPEASLDASQ